MIIIMKKGSSKDDAEPILERIRALDLQPLYMPGEEKIVIGAIGDERVLANLNLDSLNSVERVIPILKPYKLSNREFRQQRSKISVGDVVFGGEKTVIIAGPCACLR